MHDDPSVDAVTLGNKLLFRRRRVNQKHIRLALFSHGHGLAGTDGDRLYEIFCLLFKYGNQNIQKSGILGAGGRRQNDIFLFRWSGRSRRHTDNKGQNRHNRKNKTDAFKPSHHFPPE
jgi:hypothetical protein